jgi:hypothetical protein
MRRDVCRFLTIALAGCALAAFASAAAAGPHDALIARHAAVNGVPEKLVHRVVRIESGGNAAATHAGNFGLMQIRLGTARALGYTGDPRGLLDADTNLTYAVRYLAGAYRAAGCNEQRAVSYYQRGYYGTRPQDCGSSASPPLQIVRADGEPVAKVTRERGSAAAKQKSDTLAAADVIKPKVVRTETIATSGPALVRPIGTFEPKRIPPPPQQAGAVTKPDASEPPAKMELASVPLPPARPEITPLPKPKARQAHQAMGVPVHADKKTQDKDSDVVSTVLTSLKKLVTPDKTTHKRAATVEAEMDPPTQVQPPQ